MSLLVPEGLLEKMHAAVRAAYPEEACGVLIGTAGEDFARTDRNLQVRSIRPLKNAWEGSQKRVRYQVSGEEILAIERELSGGPEAIVGFYHSHPDVPAWPSPFDLERAWPFYAYAIISVRKGEVREARCWRLSDDGKSFLEEGFKVLKESRGRS